MSRGSQHGLCKEIPIEVPQHGQQLDVGEGGGCDVVGSGRVSEIKHKVLCNQRQNVEVQHLLMSAFL